MPFSKKSKSTNHGLPVSNKILSFTLEQDNENPRLVSSTSITPNKKKKRSSVSITPDYKRKKRSSNFAEMTRKVLQYLKEKSIESLMLYLGFREPEILQEFCKNFEPSLLGYAISYAPTAKFLSFLFEKMPRDEILKELTAEDFYFITRFLRVESQLDKEENYSEKKKQVISEKMNLILQLNDEGINAAVQNILAKEEMSSNIRECIQQYQESTIKPSFP